MKTLFEKVTPMHIDKIADRLGGALVDLAYKKDPHAIIAGECLLGHKKVYVICETSVHFETQEVQDIVNRLFKNKSWKVTYVEVPQDPHLAANQEDGMKCGDNGIFSGTPVTLIERQLTDIVKKQYELAPFDGKYIMNDGYKVIACHSGIKTEDWKKQHPDWIINPLGDWENDNLNDSGAPNRKLGSDLGSSASGGGIHFKDLSKADVSATIYAFLRAQEIGKPVELHCAIGDTELIGYEGSMPVKVSYKKVVDVAKKYIKKIGGFEKLGEWGLIR